MGCGGQCVIIIGVQLMQQWCADNWDTLVQVKVSMNAFEQL